MSVVEVVVLVETEVVVLWMVEEVAVEVEEAVGAGERLSTESQLLEARGRPLDQRRGHFGLP